ncbi:MAG TPA: DNA polymerase III subunit gamma/tau [Candidatus Paceibacterota bacterium]|jgi:DNA polymerase-3 subunit gamma/tau|nr:DNA polymerase III subunit gamma/tau [Candidatus Paceibacterota bacterium]
MAKKADSQERAPVSLYRAYRPSNFEEVRGQEHVVAVLKAAVKDQKVAHAYLFAGGRGTGKTSMARILARALGTDEQDIYEMDAASNRGIDEMRELREGVSTLPFASRYKFYIIDEAHALTKDAWGALLKTLEEPPSHVIFVLATTELDRVPETIISRCQVFNFKKPSLEILKKLVRDVAAQEVPGNKSFGPNIAEAIALMGDGSFRDTLGILQKVLTVESKITEEDLIRLVGAPSGVIERDFIKSIADGKLDVAVALVEELVSKTDTDLKIFTFFVINKIRMVLLLRFSPTMEKQLTDENSEELINFLKDIAKTSKCINSNLLSELLRAYMDMGKSPLPQIPLELALYRALGEV